MNTWIKKARYPTLVIFLAKCRRQKRFGQFGESTCVLGHGSTMDSNGNKLVSSLRMDRPQNAQSPLLFVPDTGWQSKDTTADLGRPRASCYSHSCWSWRSLAPQLRLEHAPNPVHWAQEVTDTELASCFFCPLKHKDGQSVTTSKFFFHFFLQYTNSLVRTLAWNYAKVCIPLFL